MGFEPQQRTALAAITPGAAARVLTRDLPALKFIEQVEYNGRRLAKLNLPPSAILEALQEYDRLLAPALEELIPDEHANFQWVRDQLHFCVILTLNNAYYQVREAETQAFYERFALSSSRAIWKSCCAGFSRHWCMSAAPMRAGCTC